MLVLGDLVAQEDLGLTLLSGGADALEREIAGAHSIDVEAPTRFLEPRWVMLTAGMRLKGSVSAQRALVAELDGAGISALGFGVELAFKRVPPAVLEEARERSFPVLAVPLGTAFRDIAGFVSRSLLSSDLHTYQRLTAIQRHLVDALREPSPRTEMVERLARMLDAGVLLFDGAGEVCAGSVPDADRVRRRLAEREFEEDGRCVVALPIGPSGWLAIATRTRGGTRLARGAVQAAVPLLAATERLAELTRDQDRAVRAALLDELLDLPPGADTRGLAARAAAFGVTLPARVLVTDEPFDGFSTARSGRTVALISGEVDVPGAVGRPVHDLADVTHSYRDAVLALARGVRAYEDLDLPALLLSEVAPERVAPRVDALLAPLGPPLLEALTEYFARDMDVAAAAEAMHVHPNTLRYRLGRVEHLLDRSLRDPGTITELMLALLSRAV